MKSALRCSARTASCARGHEGCGSSRGRHDPRDSADQARESTARNCAAAPANWRRISCPRLRLAEQIPLCIVAAHALQPVELALGFDTFRRHAQPEAARQPEHCGEDRCIARLRIDLLHERSIDLDRVRREGLQVGE